MMSALTRKHAEVKRLLELYDIYKDSPEDWRRRKAHVDLDRFLMENRETAIMCMERVLAEEIEAQIVARKASAPRSPWYVRILGGLSSHTRRSAEGGASEHDISQT